MSDIKLNTPDEDVLKRCLENALTRHYDRKVSVISLVQEHFDRQTSFLTYVVKLRLENDDTLKVFVKDFGLSSLPKDALPLRREREYLVYRDLLSSRQVSVPDYYGAVWQPEDNRFWLLLEYVNGTELRYLDFDYWVKAASWLGDFNGVFRDRKDELKAAEFLIQHDADFFLTKAEAAVNAVSEFSNTQARRLKKVLDRYDRVVKVMLSRPRTLVHGSFRPQNIMLALQQPGEPVCPVDWELAAYGADLYDLAFIVDGFKSPQLDIMLDAYCSHAAHYGIDCSSRKDMLYVINCFRLHKIIKSLSDSVSFGFPATTVDKLVGMAEAVETSVR